MITNTQKHALMQAATEALKNPYPNDAKLVFSAAVLTANGNIYSAAQYFSDTFSLTLHGEQLALAHAATHGEGEVVALAATSNEPEGALSYPCHMCKQLMWESRRRSKKPMLIIVFDRFGNVEEFDLDSLMSHPWPESI